MIRNKRGLDMIQTLGAIVLMIFLIVGVGYWYIKTQGEGAGTVGAISVSANAIIIDSCNAYCAYINGDQVSGIGGVTITGREGAIYSYCQELHSFVKENNQRTSMTCVKASENTKLGITAGCRSLCSEEKVAS